jgi:CubicO group peptidase (beta-lactamase class C family)
MSADDRRLAERVREAASSVIEKHRVPGLTVGVVRGDDVVFCESFGYAEVETKTPMSPQRRQCIASITKTMVGLCTMALVDEGRLRLDQGVQELLPDLRIEGPGAPMTVWHLLTHTGGIGEAPTVEQLRDFVNPDQSTKKPPSGFAEMYERGLVTEFEPGTKWHYANNGYNLLGEIIRRVEGTPHLQDVLERRIFGPLGMRDSDILGQPHDTLSVPYHRRQNEDTREQLERAGIPIPDEEPVDGLNIRGRFAGEFNEAALAAGGVQSTMPDMLRYASALLRHGGGIVRPETFDAMIAPAYEPDPRLVSWGLSFSRVPATGRVWIGHGGAYFGGWNSNLGLLPAEGVAVVQFMNIMLDEPAPIFAAVKRAVLDVPRPTVTAGLATARDVLEQAPGLYELTPGRLTNFRPATRIGRITVTRDGDGLTLTSRWGNWKRGVRLVPDDPSDPLFFAIEREDATDHLLFTRGADGRIDGLRCDELVRMVRVADAG